MKTFKSVIALLLAALILISFSACSASGSSDPNAGTYTALTAEMLGVSVEVADFFPDGFTIELKDGGKCKINAGSVSSSGKWTLDNTTFHIEGGGLDCDGTLENNRIRLTNVMNMGVDIIFYKEGAPVINEVYYIPYTTYSFEEAISYATHIPGTATEDVDLYGDWYGYLHITNAWGYQDNSDELVDITGVIDTDVNSDRPFLDLYVDDADGAVLSMYIDIYDDYVFANIGDEDAWFMNRYLTEDEAYNFSSGLYDGKLVFYYDYVDPDGEDAGYTAEICIRKYGDYWDEDDGILPPGYYDYVEALN